MVKRQNAQKHYMLKNKIVVLMLTFMFVFTNVNVSYAKPEFYNYVTGILKGEGAELNSDLSIMACTVRNRLDRGWGRKSVMNHYYGRYIIPSREEIELVSEILNEKESRCGKEYFFYATWYADLWIKDSIVPLVVIGGHNYYIYEDYKRMWK